MLNFKKLASTFIFSILAFQSTACAVPRYAKVVLLGGKGSGKTTIQKLINKDYDISNIPHTTQISYISVPVFYDNKGNFTFDEDRDVQRYNKEVILNICDTPSENDISCDYNTEEYKKQAENNEKILKCVDEFALKKPIVIVALANADNFDSNESYDIKNDYRFIDRLQNIVDPFFHHHFRNNYKETEIGKCRKIAILTHEDPRNIHEFLDMTEEEAEKIDDGKIFGKLAIIGYLKGFFKNIPNFDAVKILTIYGIKIKEENKKTNNKIEKKCAANDSKLAISREVNLEYTMKIEEIFNQNNKEDLKKYADTILGTIARSVYKYGINNLPLYNNDSDWRIIDGKLVKGH